MRSIRGILLAGITTAALIAGGAAPATASTPTPSPSPSASAPAPSPTPTPTPTPTVPPVATTFAQPIAAKTYSLSSHYGPRCIPLQGASTHHLGVDLAAPAGTPIYAIAAGIVTHTVTGTASQVGYISVKHNIAGAEYTSIYMHIWSATTRVKVGQIVAAGQRISEVGSSGVSSGNHLHLELWKAAPGGAVSQNPTTFLKARSVDLYASTTAVTAKATPATCTYYTTGGVNFRTGPSTAYTSLRLLPLGTAMTHVPGQITSGFIPVKVGTQSGWVSAALVSPVKPAPPKPAPAVVKPTTYVTTAALNLRTHASTTGASILVIPKGASVGAILDSRSGWRKVTYSGKTGWVSATYLAAR